MTNMWLKKMDEISQYAEDIDQEQQENIMYNNLVEKQQRHFNNRLHSIFWTKDTELQKKYTEERMVAISELDYVKYSPIYDNLIAARKKAEDIIMIGDPVKMFEAVDAFEKSTFH